MGKILGWVFGIRDYRAPWVQDQRPSVPADRAAIASFNVLDDYSGVWPDRINVRIDSVPAFSGPSTFLAPFDLLSSITPVIINGYDGYNLRFVRNDLYDHNTTHCVDIEGCDNYSKSCPVGDENCFYDSYNYCYKISRLAKMIDLRPNLYEITLDLKFDTLMMQDDNLRNSANYHFDNGMYARKVDIIDGYNVRLWVELFYGSDFILTADQNIINADGYSLPLNDDSYGISPFQSDATFSNYNGMVRTWHESGNIMSDSERIYLASTKGIDVFAKLYNSSGFFRWGHIFDEYGIDAMYVANYPSDLEITDTVAPFLANIVPSPSSFAPANTHISFDVVDTITAVEITTLRVYINGGLAFSGGYSGWQSGWFGEINIGYRQLSVELWPDVNFTSGLTVTVRIVASDFMGNEMDESYSFFINP
jgi:hypothetical protein